MAAAGVDWGEFGSLNDDRRFESLSLKDARTFAFSGLQGLFVERVDLQRSAFSADGRWLTLIEGNSVLLYDLGGA